MKIFFFFFGLHPEIRTFCDEDLFFLSSSQNSWNFAYILWWRSFLWSSLSNSRKKVFVLPQKLFIPPPPPPVTLLWRRACQTFALKKKSDVDFFYIASKKKYEVQTWKMGGRINGSLQAKWINHGKVNKMLCTQKLFLDFWKLDKKCNILIFYVLTFSPA